MSTSMKALVIVEGEEAFWEVLCALCGARVMESLHYAEADCERCGKRAEVDLGGGEA